MYLLYADCYIIPDIFFNKISTTLKHFVYVQTRILHSKQTNTN